MEAEYPINGYKENPYENNEVWAMKWMRLWKVKKKLVKRKRNGWKKEELKWKKERRSCSNYFLSTIY